MENDRIKLADGQELDMKDTTTRQLLIVATNVLAQVARKSEGCQMPEGVVKVHTEILDDLKSGMVELEKTLTKLDKAVDLMSAEVKRGNDDMGRLFKTADENRSKIIVLEKDVLEARTEKKTTTSHNGTIALIIITIVGWGLTLYGYFHK